MNKLLAVSEKLLSEDEGKSFWCTYKKYETCPGDLVIVHVKSLGISQIFRVLYIDSNSEFNCEYRGMATIRLKHIITINTPVSVKNLKGHPRLVNMNAVRRSFQATTFLVAENDWSDILDLIQKLNPELDIDQLGLTEKSV